MYLVLELSINPLLNNFWIRHCVGAGLRFGLIGRRCDEKPRPGYDKPTGGEYSTVFASLSSCFSSGSKDQIWKHRYVNEDTNYEIL